MATIVDPIGERQIAPVAFFILMNIAYVFNYFVPRVRLIQGAGNVLHFFLVAIIFVNFIFSSVFVFQSHQNGIGMNSKDFNSSSLISYLETVPPERLASNDPFAIYKLSGRSALPVPIIGNHYWSDTAIVVQDREILQKIDQEKEIFVVLFGSVNFDEQLERFLVNELNSELVLRSKLGNVYRLYNP
jgi:hypothetical protein